MIGAFLYDAVNMFITADNLSDVEKIANDLDSVSSLFMGNGSKIKINLAKAAIQSLCVEYSEKLLDVEQLKLELSVRDSTIADLLKQLDSYKSAAEAWKMQATEALRAQVDSLQCRLAATDDLKAKLKIKLTEIATMFGFALVEHV